MPDDAATSGGEADAPVDVVYLRRIQSPAQVERIALIAGLVAGVVLAGLVGWLSFRTYETQNREAQRNLFVHISKNARTAGNLLGSSNSPAQTHRSTQVKSTVCRR